MDVRNLNWAMKGRDCLVDGAKKLTAVEDSSHKVRVRFELGKAESGGVNLCAEKRRAK